MSLHNPLRVLLWWDTGIARGHDNSVYFEGGAKKSFILKEQVQYSEFVTKISQLMGISMDNVILKLRLLCPVKYDTVIQFVSMLISDDDDMEVMYQLQHDFKGLKQVQIHVEKEVHIGETSTRPEDQTIAPVSGSNTALLRQGNYFPSPGPVPIDHHSAEAPPAADVHSRHSPVTLELHRPFSFDINTNRPVSSCAGTDPLTTTTVESIASISNNETHELEQHQLRVYADAVTELVQHERTQGPMQPAEMDAHGPTSDVEAAGADSDSDNNKTSDDCIEPEKLVMQPAPSAQLPTSPVASPLRTHQPPGTSFFARLGDFDSNEATNAGVSFAVDMWSESNSDLRLGMNFIDKAEAVTAARIWSIKQGGEFHVVQSKSAVWRAKCKVANETQCKWYMRVIPKKKLGVWQLTKFYPEHTCITTVDGNDHGNLSSRLVAKNILHLIAKDPEEKIKTIRGHIYSTMNARPTYKKCWQGRRIAIEMVYGNWPSSFATLPQFLEAIVESNPGTVVEWKHHQSSTQDVKCFGHLFWAFGPCIQAFRHAHKVVSVDGTHLRGAYKGKLLVAIAVDSNNHVLPLAFAIVDEETANSWGWFLALVRRHVIGNEEQVCLISDRHHAIINAVSMQVEWQPPMAHHRFCLRHIRNSFHTRFKDPTLKILCWQAGRSRKVHKFNATIESIKQINEDAYKWLIGIPLQMWTLSHDGGLRCGQLTTNLSECCNNVVKGARALPIKSCVNLTFQRLAEYFRQHRKDAAECEGPFPKNSWKKFRYSEGRSRIHTAEVLNAQIGIFNVTSRRLLNGKGGNNYTVNISMKHCSCGKWTIFKMPCSHAIAACTQVCLNPESLVTELYSTAAYQATYDGQFYPIPHEDYWKPSPFTLEPVDSQMKHNRSGRLGVRRTANVMDSPNPKTRQRCSNCEESGHNMLRCAGTREP